MRGEVDPPEPKAKCNARKRKRGKQPPAKEPADEPNGEALEDDGDGPAQGDGGDGTDLPTADGGKLEQKPKRKTPKVTPDDVLSKWKLQDQMWKKKQHNSMCCVLKTKKIFGVIFLGGSNIYIYIYYIL